MTSNIRFGHEIIKTKVLQGSILYEEQKEALRRIIDWFDNPNTAELTSVVVMPTGTGKTGVICCLPYMFGWAVKEGKIKGHDLSKPILVIAPGVTILKQLQANLCYDDEYISPFLIKREILANTDITKLYRTLVVKSTKTVQNLDSMQGFYDVVLSNAQKWKNDSSSEPAPNYTGLNRDLFSAVIVDEAHHLPAKQWKNIIHHFKDAKVIFFTATPKRHDKKLITEDLSLNGYTYELSRDNAIDRRLIRKVTFNDSYEGDDKDVAKWKVLKAMKSRLEEKNTMHPLPDGVKHGAIVITKNKGELEGVHGICSKWPEMKVIECILGSIKPDNLSLTKLQKEIMILSLLWACCWRDSTILH